MKEKPLYKYLYKKHAKRMVENGQIRLGTLYEYRDEEKYNEQVGDSKEGEKTRIHEVEGLITYKKSADQHPGTKAIRWDGTGSLSIEDSIFEYEENFPDSYIYCMSSEYNPILMNEFGYNCCVEVFRPFIFFSAIYEYLHYLNNYELETYFAQECIYKPRTEIFDNPSGVPPALLKDPEYAHQKEFRAVYVPRDKSKRIEPLFIENNCIPKTCRIK